MTGQVRKDDGFPYPGFADNAHMYARSRAFWTKAFSEITPTGNWVAWMQDPLRDGNPIFSRIDKDLKRGVLVQQVAFSDDPVWFKCWISHFSDPERDPLPYLFVETFVSWQAKDLFQKLLRRWKSPKCSDTGVSRLADQMRLQAADRYAQIEFEADRPGRALI